MTALSFLSSGKINSGEAEIIIRPKSFTGEKRGVLFVHGVEAANGGAFEWQKFDPRAQLISSIASAGYTVVSADLGGNATWGNATALARISSARNYLLTQGVLPDQIAIIAASMGALNALCWIAANPGLASCFIGLLPVVNLTDVHANNRGGFRGTINAAYGGTYSEAANGATHNPATMAAAGKYLGVPMSLYYGESDSIVLPTTVSAFAGSAGVTCIATAIPGGHAESTIAGLNISSLISFLGLNE